MPRVNSCGGSANETAEFSVEAGLVESVPRGDAIAWNPSSPTPALAMTPLRNVRREVDTAILSVIKWLKDGTSVRSPEDSGMARNRPRRRRVLPIEQGWRPRELNYVQTASISSDRSLYVDDRNGDCRGSDGQIGHLFGMVCGSGGPENERSLPGGKVCDRFRHDRVETGFEQPNCFCCPCLG